MEKKRRRKTKREERIFSTDSENRENIPVDFASRFLNQQTWMVNKMTGMNVNRECVCVEFGVWYSSSRCKHLSQQEYCWKHGMCER